MKQTTSAACTMILLTLGAMTNATASAQTAAQDSISTHSATQAVHRMPVKRPAKSRLTVGGYGEAVMTRNFYSDEFNRYSHAEDYKDADSHGRFDLPHVVINLGYDFGKGWTMGSEIEFEHGGTESAIEMEAEEAGEYEAEVERGGEVALEQFWIQKSFCPQLNIRMGEIIVPVGLTNQHHMPTEFFTVYRPEGENTIFPCTWHETGVSIWGRTRQWRYEAQFLAGLDADRFGSESFIHYGSGSPYEFKIANKYAAAARLDNYSFAGLRLGASGYYGRTFRNSLTKSTKYADCEGDIYIGSVDFQYDRHNWVARGSFDYAHLGNADEISAFNINSFPSKYDDNPSKRQVVGSDAMAAGVEAGYDFFGLSRKLHDDQQRLFLFGRYEYYDSMLKGSKADAYKWCGKHRMAVGINYYPMPQIVLKGEFSKRFYVSPYNDEPSISLGIAYCGYFL